MVKKIKLPLEMANGKRVGTIEELKANWDLEKVVLYYENGRLLTWLKDRYYSEEATQVAALESIADIKDLQKGLCNIFSMPFDEEKAIDINQVKVKNKKIERILRIAPDDEYINNADSVAFVQDDLMDLINKKKNVIYLCNNNFTIPLNVKNIKYKGIGDVTCIIDSKEEIDFEEMGIVFENVKFDEKYIKCVKNLNANDLKIVGATVLGALLAGQAGAAVGGAFATKAFGNKKVSGDNNSKEMATNKDLNEVADELYKKGWKLEHGEGVEQNIDLAISLYKEAAAIGNPMADLKLCTLSEVEEEGYSKTLKAAIEDNPDAMFDMGRIFSSGKYGKGIDKKIADYWYKKAIEQGGEQFKKVNNAAEGGDVSAMYIMGYIYELGKCGKAIDKTLAKKWYTKAVEAGYSEAQFKLNEMEKEEKKDENIVGNVLFRMFGLANNSKK